MDSFSSQGILKVGEQEYKIFRLAALEKKGFNISSLPYTLRILLENLLRMEDGRTVKASDIEALARWNSKDKQEREIAFMPGRVLLQDFTGVPAIVDLAAMRDAMKKMGGNPQKINPLQPVELVIDHSVQVDAFGSSNAFQINVDLEFDRNNQRYIFLRWGQKAFNNFKVVPPGTGIVHQVNLEYLARGVMTSSPTAAEAPLAYPDTLVGTDSHTTMINGLGVLGWGVGGIEAEAAMLGQPLSMLIPEVVGFHLKGRLREGATATDLVLTVTQMLRKKGVVGKFVEFFGAGLSSLSLADRATIANMAPEYGATCGFFPVDQESLNYLKLSGRTNAQIALVEAYMKEQGLFATDQSPVCDYSDLLELDISSVEPSLAGPKRPQDRLGLSEVAKNFQEFIDPVVKETPQIPKPKTSEISLQHGSVVIAAITSCTNTSNPSVMLAAGLLAKKAVERGLSAKPWVKTSLAPGSKVVTDYLTKAGLSSYLEKLGFHLVGFGCTTCIGNSGPLPQLISEAIEKENLVVCSVLSGNRNFEGRINPDVRANYLASPPLVVAYALTGRIDLDLTKDSIGLDAAGKPVFLKDIWPTEKEIQETIERFVDRKMFQERYGNVYDGDENWRKLPVPEGATYAWDAESTYIQNPPYFVGMPKEPPPPQDIRGARVLAVLGDSVTTDHISPAGSIKKGTPAAQYLEAHGVLPKDYNSYGARRGNHEVMMRGTFANIRLRNKLVPGVEGGVTLHLPDKKQMFIYDAAVQYKQEKTPLIILAGKEYGSGSSRDWAAKGPMLLGVKVVIAESFERIHRSNLVGMGILPLEFKPGDSPESLKLTGQETFHILGITEAIQTRFKNSRDLEVQAVNDAGNVKKFSVRTRIDTPQEIDYYHHGGILQYVLRKLLKEGEKLY